jgi:oxygen-independent coproporphyrinogen-3 oxidase
MPGVYISYPFCAQKCTYCNFASGVFPKELEPQYQAKLRESLRQTTWPWTPQTVYLGGGTPSLWPLEDLAETLATIPGAPWREATLECAPGSLSPEKVIAWRNAGINRVSLGVQSFVEKELRRTGRKHDAEIVRRDVALLRNEGIPNINIDLIAGLAGQDEASWRVSLDALADLNPPHASVYILEVDEDSRLGAEVLLNGQRYGATDIPSDTQQVEFYQQAVERLAAMGLGRYEISNFARPGFESLHNLKYWRLEEYLGFGADAHSSSGGWRWSNPESPADYVAAGEAQLDRLPADPARERYWVGLRLLSGIEDAGLFPQEVADLVGQGLLEKRGGRLRLTPQAVVFSNEVFEKFIPDAHDRPA